VPRELNQRLAFLPADLQDFSKQGPFVIIVRSLPELERALHNRSPAVQWLQIEDLLRTPEAWALAAQGSGETPFDVLVSAPGEEFSYLYRLADVRTVRSVRVTMPTTSGFLKALRLAASLGLPVRLLPGNPTAEALEELSAALEFYIHDPMVEAPIEFFHSSLVWMRGMDTGSLWRITEEDPGVFLHQGTGTVGFLRSSDAWLDGGVAADFVAGHLARLIDEGSECATCPWQQLCQGYFKWPDASYSCHSVKKLFAALRAAADEIECDLSTREAQPT
jgi:hypothetical protein